MDAEKHSYTLEDIPANRRLIEELYAHGKITKQAREYALNFLYPHDQWGLWTSRLLLTISVTLILSGIVYFSAFNWARVPPHVKLGSIQLGIISCIIGAYFYSLQVTIGKTLMLSASVLVGVFMAVFGQIYQTGADAYQLFMMWSLLIFAWTLVSNFAAQWVLWLVITNIALVLWWGQAAFPSQQMRFMIYIYLSILNGTALILLEYFSMAKKYDWLQVHWTRMLLIIAILSIMLIPTVTLIMEVNKATQSIMLSGLVGIIGHAGAYYFYRYQALNIKSLAVAVLSIFIIVEALSIKILLEIFPRIDDLILLLMGFLTLGIFTFAIAHVREAAKEMGVDYD